MGPTRRRPATLAESERVPELDRMGWELRSRPAAVVTPAARLVEAGANARALLKAMKIDVAATRTAVGRPAEEIIEAG